MLDPNPQSTTFIDDSRKIATHLYHKILRRNLEDTSIRIGQ